jgi:hypothetical protein
VPFNVYTHNKAVPMLKAASAYKETEAALESGVHYTRLLACDVLRAHPQRPLFLHPISGSRHSRAPSTLQEAVDTLKV